MADAGEHGDGAGPRGRRGEPHERLERDAGHGHEPVVGEPDRAQGGRDRLVQRGQQGPAARSEGAGEGGGGVRVAHVVKDQQHLQPGQPLGQGAGDVARAVRRPRARRHLLEDLAGAGQRLERRPAGQPHDPPENARRVRGERAKAAAAVLLPTPALPYRAEARGALPASRGRWRSTPIAAASRSARSALASTCGTGSGTWWRGPSGGTGSVRSRTRSVTTASTASSGRAATAW